MALDFMDKIRTLVEIHAVKTKLNKLEVKRKVAGRQPGEGFYVMDGSKKRPVGLGTVYRATRQAAYWDFLTVNKDTTTSLSGRSNGGVRSTAGNFNLKRLPAHLTDLWEERTAQWTGGSSTDLSDFLNELIAYPGPYPTAERLYHHVQQLHPSFFVSSPTERPSKGQAARLNAARFRQLLSLLGPDGTDQIAVHYLTIYRGKGNL